MHRKSSETWQRWLKKKGFSSNKCTETAQRRRITPGSPHRSLVTETLATEALATKALATEALATEALGTEALATEALATEALATEASATEALATEAFANRNMKHVKITRQLWLFTTTTYVRPYIYQCYFTCFVPFTFKQLTVVPLPV